MRVAQSLTNATGEAVRSLDFESEQRRQSTSWERADARQASIEAIGTYGYRVSLPDSDNEHVVAIGKREGLYVGYCECRGFEYNPGPCAHLCALRKADYLGEHGVNVAEVEVSDEPPTPDLSVLTDAERNAYVACRIGDTGVREYQRERGYSSKGTVSNLLKRAENKLDELRATRGTDTDRAQRTDGVTGGRRAAGEVSR